MPSFVSKTALVLILFGTAIAVTHPVDAIHKCPDPLAINRGCAFLDHPETSQEEAAPVFTFEKGLAIPGLPDPSTGSPAQIVRWLFFLAMGSVGVLALIMLVVGGVQFVASAIDPSARSAARNRIQAALTGLLLALASFLVLYTLNPDLVRLRDPSLPCVSCKCAEEKSPNLMPGVSLANCVQGEAFPGIGGTKLTDVLGSQDDALIGIFKDETKGTSGDAYKQGLKKFAKRAVSELGYRAIYSDDKDIVKCMAYCMLEKSSGDQDFCGYTEMAIGGDNQCKKTWDTLTKGGDRNVPSGVDWRCHDGDTEPDWTDSSPIHGGGTMILDFFKTKQLCISSASCAKLRIGCTDADNPIDDEVLGCPLLSTYVAKAVTLFETNDDWVLCKCANISKKQCVTQDQVLGL